MSRLPSDHPVMVFLIESLRMLTHQLAHACGTESAASILRHAGADLEARAREAGSWDAQLAAQLEDVHQQVLRERAQERLPRRIQEAQ